MASDPRLVGRLAGCEAAAGMAQSQSWRTLHQWRRSRPRTYPPNAHAGCSRALLQEMGGGVPPPDTVRARSGVVVAEVISRSASGLRRLASVWLTADADGTVSRLRILQ